MVKAIICGYYGQANAGDEALLLAILARLPENVKPIVLSANPRKTSDDYGVTCCSRQEIVQQIWQANKQDLFIWGGGSLIQDVTSIKSPLYYLGLMKLAQFKGLKTIAYAQGIGPINTPWIRWLTKKILYKCDRISVRDQKSAQLLKSWQVEYLIAPDPVWALPSKPITNLDLIPSPRIAINLRCHHSLTLERLEILAEAIAELQAKTKANILLVPFQKSQDLQVCEQVAQKLGSNYQIIHLENPQQLKGLWSQIDMMIGMRLHSLIMAMSEKCPCFALSYDPKVTSLMREVGIEGYELETLPTVVSDITEKIFQKYCNLDTLSDKIIQNLANSALQHQYLIDSLIH